MIRIGRFVLAIVTFVAFSLNSTNYAHAWDFTLRGDENSSLRRNASSPGNTSTAATSGFTESEQVTVTVTGVVVTPHLVPVQPTVLPYNPNIPIVNITPVVTAGTRPLVVGGPSCTITIYGTDSAGNLYNISSAAWMSPPQVVQWTSFTSGPPMPGGMTPDQLAAFIQANVLDLGYSTNSGKVAGMSFNEQAPANSPNTVSDIQVTSIVAMNAPLPNGSIQSWAFNDLVSTVPAGTVVTTQPTYDVELQIPGNPPFTTKILNMPAASLSAITN